MTSRDPFPFAVLTLCVAVAFILARLGSAERDIADLIRNANEQTECIKALNAAATQAAAPAAAKEPS